MSEERCSGVPAVTQGNRKVVCKVGAEKGNCNPDALLKERAQENVATLVMMEVLDEDLSGLDKFSVILPYVVSSQDCIRANVRTMGVDEAGPQLCYRVSGRSHRG